MCSSRAADQAIKSGLGGMLRRNGDGDGIFVDDRADVYSWEFGFGLGFRLSKIRRRCWILDLMYGANCADDPRSGEPNTRSFTLLSHEV